MSLDRVRERNPIRAALQQAMLSPRVQQAVAVFVNALVDEGESILQQKYAGESLRTYVPKRGGHEARAERDRRIQALAAPPSSMPPARIAAQVGVSERHVRRLLKKPA